MDLTKIPTKAVVEAGFFSLLLLNVSKNCLTDSAKTRRVIQLLTDDVIEYTAALYDHQKPSYKKHSKLALDAYLAAFYDRQLNKYDAVKVYMAIFDSIQRLKAPVTDRLSDAVREISGVMFETHNETWNQLLPSVEKNMNKAIKEIKILGLFS